MENEPSKTETFQCEQREKENLEQLEPEKTKADQKESQNYIIEQKDKDPSSGKENLSPIQSLESPEMKETEKPVSNEQIKTGYE